MLFYGTRLENADVVPENWRESRLLNSTSVPLVANCLAFVLCMHSDHWNCPLFRFFLRRLKLDLAILAGSGVICSIRKLQTATGEQQSRCRSNERRKWHVLGPRLRAKHLRQDVSETPSHIPLYNDQPKTSIKCILSFYRGSFYRGFFV